MTTPQRPQRRGAQADQRSAGLLVEVVRTLTTSPSQAQKELQKERLEKDYAVTSHNIDRLLTDHQQDLTSSLQTFRKVSAKLSTSRERVRSLKNNLASCKTLLQCKRDELKQLWFESAEQNRVVKLLNIVESVKIVPREVDDSVSRKHFLLAVRLLVDANNDIREYLGNVEGVQEIKENVDLRTKNIYDQILCEIDRQIYLKPLEELFFELKRISSMRRTSGSHLIAETDQQQQQQHQSKSSLADDATQHGAAARRKSSSHLSLPSSLKSLNNVYSKLSEDESPILMDDGLAYEDTGPNYSPENNYVQYLAILLEALGVLGRLSQGVDVLKQSISRGLARLTQHTSLYVYEHFSTTEQNIGDNRLLSELLQLLFRQFKSVSVIHGYVVNQIKRVQTNCDLQRDKDLTCYTSHDVWQEIQFTLRRLLNDYLDVNNSASYAMGVTKSAIRSVADSSLKMDDWSKYFARKKPQRPAKPSYFRFASTAHSIESKTFGNERRFFDLAATANRRGGGCAPKQPLDYFNDDAAEERLYVCQPDPDNVTIIFKPLIRFVAEIESRDTSTPCCPLRAFLEEFTREVYLPKIRADTDRRLEAVLGHSDSWEQLATSDQFVEMSDLFTNRQRVPLLSCALRVYLFCKSFEQLAQSAPAFLEHFAQLWLKTLWHVVESAEAAYESATGSSLASMNRRSSLSFSTTGQKTRPIHFPAHEKRKISASWAVDEDISRLLKSLPNWTILLTAGHRHSVDDSSSVVVGAYNNGFDQAADRQVSPGPDSAPTPMSATGSSSFDSSSAQEIRSRNQRESEILIGSLGNQKHIDENEVILDDFGRLRSLANMHESLEWLSKQTRQLVGHLSPASVGKLKEIGLTMLNESTNQQLFSNLYNELLKSADSLQDTANTCLLMLHLEIRVHCFYYVLNTLHSQFNVSSQCTVDESILKLNKNVVQFHEICRTNLQPRKVKYVFEGLGHLLSSIFINCCQNIAKLNSTSKKRLCSDLLSVQQCLAGLTRNREPDLDSALRFFNLLHKDTPDDILDDILRNGPEFKELDYQNLLALFIRSHLVYGNEPGMLDKYSSRLKEIMYEKRRREQ